VSKEEFEKVQAVVAEGVAREGLQDVVLPAEEAAAKRLADIASDEAVDRMIADAQEAGIPVAEPGHLTSARPRPVTAGRAHRRRSSRAAGNGCFGRGQPVMRGGGGADGSAASARWWRARRKARRLVMPGLPILPGGAAVSGSQAYPPELVPVLSRGKHRSPRKGACFMELASYLAGERWSDHPACTHPLLAAVARDVNDYTSDAGRARLAGLIPSVIGLAGDDLHLDARIALGCARMALPVVAAERQQVMAVSVLACERVLAALDGRPAGWLEEQSQRALAQVPHAARWARGFIRDIPISAKAFRRRCAPYMAHAAVEGIALACVPEPDEILRELLVGAIGVCAAWAGQDTGRGTARPVAARTLTGTAIVR
jgi:hypothetical protein